MKRIFRPIRLMVNPEAVLIYADQILLVNIVTKCTNGKTTLGIQANLLFSQPRCRPTNAL